MIYVTHDQTEALTFADTVVVMHDGRVVQSGTPAELFDKPAHTFVGYFIGSPGMNIVPAEVSGREARIDGHVIALNRSYDELPAGAKIEIGVRPEFVHVAAPAPALLSAKIERIDDLGRVRFARVRVGEPNSPRRVPPGFSVAGQRRSGSCSIPPMFTSMPTAVWSRGLPDGQDRQPEGLVPGAAGVPDRRVLRDPAADDGRELFDAGHLRQQPVLLERRRLVQGTARSLDRSRRALPRLARPQSAVLRHHPRDRGAARHRGGAVDAARRLARRRLPRDPRAAAADPVERGRHHLADLWPARHRPARLYAQQPRHQLQLRLQRARCLGHRHRDGRLALDQPRRAALLRRPEVDPRRLLSGGADRRRLALGGVQGDPAAEDEPRAADRRAAALHGQFHDLHRAVRGHRRRARQLDHLRLDRTRQDRARAVRSRQGRGAVAGLQPHHPDRVLGVLHRHDQCRRRASRQSREPRDEHDSRPPHHHGGCS